MEIEPLICFGLSYVVFLSSAWQNAGQETFMCLELILER